MKIKHLTLSFPHYDEKAPSIEAREAKHNLLYRVEKAVDTTEYPPGTLLRKADVDALCAANGWNITMLKVK